MLDRLLEQLIASPRMPEPLPAEPLGLLEAWYQEAERSGAYEDFNAMSLATATRDGRPSVRVVLCKGIEPDRAAITFFTNYQSRKGRELETNPRAAAVFYWPHAARQARVEGCVERFSDAESDAYFATRPLLSRLGACVSRQSEPIESRAALMRDAMSLAAGAAIGRSLERPEHWGGYRLRLDAVELWCAGNGRLHERVLWRRETTADDAPWSRSLLSP